MQWFGGIAGMKSSSSIAVLLLLAALALAWPAEAMDAACPAQGSHENCAGEDREMEQRNAPGISPCRRLTSPPAPVRQCGACCMSPVAKSTRGSLSLLDRPSGDVLALTGTLRI